MTVRVGIIGTGGMAGAHVRWYKTLRGVRLTACMDVDQERAATFAKTHGIATVVDNVDDLFDHVDAVSVVTPDQFHAHYSLQVLAAEKHLFCEKPLTVTMAEARKVAKAFAKAQKKGIVGKVNFSHRGHHSNKAAQLVADGAIGEVRHVRAHYLQGWLSAPDLFDRPGRIWRLQTAKGSGGVLGDLGCHILDFTSHVAGPVKQLRCSLRTLPKRDRQGRIVKKLDGVALDANDTADCELEFANGAFGVLHTTRWATGRQNDVELEVHGTEGAICLGHIVPDKPWMRVLRQKGRYKGEWREQKLSTAWDHPWRRFIRAITTGEEVDPNIQRGAEIQAQLDACFRSAASGTFVKPAKV